MPTHVLVTGGAGYVGAILTEHLLAAGHIVTVIDNLRSGGGSLWHLCAHRRFDFINGDVRDEPLMRALVTRADAIVPLAAIVGAPACDREPELAHALNLEAIRLLNRIRGTSQLVIFPTTISGYGTQTTDTPCDEDTPLNPISLYARTKMQAEAELLESGGVISLRLATAFGMSPQMRIDLLVNHFVYAAVTAGQLTIFEPDFLRDFVHVRDIADCVAHCIEHAGRMMGRPYNVGLDAANLSKEALALKIKAHVPDFSVRFASSGRDPDQRNYVVSSDRMRQQGFEARRGLDEGIEELIKGYRMTPPGRLEPSGR
jgi:nucleoside-diphosphate-sugar epimerase